MQFTFVPCHKMIAVCVGWNKLNESDKSTAVIQHVVYKQSVERKFVKSDQSQAHKLNLPHYYEMPSTHLLFV